MSRTDDEPVGNDESYSYDPNHIEREFVLAPAWRAFKARIRGLLPARRTQTAEEYALDPPNVEAPRQNSLSLQPNELTNVAEMNAVTSYETVPAASQETEPISFAEPEPAALQEFQSNDAGTLDSRAEQVQPFSSAVLEPAGGELLPASSEELHPIVLPQLEPVASQEVGEERWQGIQQPAASQQVLPSEFEDFEDERTTLEKLRPMSLPEMVATESATPSLASGGQVLGLPADTYPPDVTGVREIDAPTVVEMPSVNRDLVATRYADVSSKQITNTPRLVVIATNLDSWIRRKKARLADGMRSVGRRFSKPQQELFSHYQQPLSRRDQVWWQAAGIAAAVCVAFLIGWTSASSRAQKASSNGVTVKAGGVTLLPVSSAGTSAGVTVRAGGVTLLPASSVGTSAVMNSAPAPAGVAAIRPIAAKPTPVRSASGHTQTAKPGAGHHLRRTLPADDEVVTRHYDFTTKKVVAQSQSGQVKKYSDTN